MIKPRIRKATKKIHVTNFNALIVNPSFIGLWMCGINDFNVFGDSPKDAFKAFQRVCKYEALSILNDNYEPARSYLKCQNIKV